MKHNIEVFVPVLMKFKNDEVVFSDEQLKGLENEVLNEENDIIENESYDENRKRNSCFKHCIQSLFGLEMHMHKVHITKENTKIELYYYHHRVILRYVFNLETEDKINDLIRELRGFIKEHSKRFVENNVIRIANDYLKKKWSKQEIASDGKILMYYSYTIMFVQNKNKWENNMSHFLGTQTFRIVEAQERLFRYGREHYVRISIPGTIVYYKRKIGYFLKIDMINSVYQYVLYNKKNFDAENGKVDELQDFDRNKVEEYNTITEKQLFEFWEYAMDALGGKIVNNQNQKTSIKSFALSIAAMLISILGIILPLIISSLSGVKK